MKLKELMKSVFWSKVREALLVCYEDAERSMDGHAFVFERLRVMEPENSKMVICIDRERDGDSDYFHVYGIRPGHDDSWSLMVCPFSEWLGFDVDEQVMVTMSEPEIVAHCLWEMTWIGFTDEQRSNYLAKLDLDREIKEVDIEQALAEGTLIELDESLWNNDSDDK